MLTLVGSLITSTSSNQGMDMDDEDFAAFLNEADKAMQRYGETAAKGCITGAAGGIPGGFPGLCIGCGLGALGNMAQEKAYPKTKTLKGSERMKIGTIIEAIFVVVFTFATLLLIYSFSYRFFH